MKRILSLVLFLLFVFSAFPALGAMSTDTFLYFDVLSQIKEEETAEVPVFSNGLWMYEILDPLEDSFSLMGARQGDESQSFYATPLDDSCRITEGVMLFSGDRMCPSLTFVAPVDGDIRYTMFGYVRQDSADAASLTLHLYRGNEEITSWEGEDIAVDQILTVTAGEKIRLVVTSSAASENPFCISSGPTLTYQRPTVPAPEPPVEETPWIPTGLRLASLSSDGVYLEWDAPAKDLCYTVYVNGEILYHGLSFSENVAPSAFVPCQPGTSYTFSVSVVGDDGMDLPRSEALKILFPSAPSADTEASSDLASSSLSAESGSEDLLVLTVWILAACVGLLSLALILLLIFKSRKKS